jgi:NADPH-dependent 2,4-dienoyl-CoA reductase/sulfur reductase-like enzyme
MGMRREIDTLIIGAGPAGLAAAVSLKQQGIENILIAEREETPGGVLFQCIHSGFGIHRFNEELTGPEYAERAIALAQEHNVEILCRSAVLDLVRRAEAIEALLLCESEGLVTVVARSVILAMGCRERNRGNLNIPGARVAGIMTAGLAQRLVNLDGLIPGKEIIILGSGDIGLIMARRLSLEGVFVKGVIEIQPFPGGLSRNIVQCLHDFHIPLYLSHTITNIIGDKRITAVEVSPIDQFREPALTGRFTLSCDTLLLSVGLIPENELSLKAGVILDEVTRGPVVDSTLMTSVPGIFACGNVLHVHDVADFVSEEANFAGLCAARYLKGELVHNRAIAVKPGNLVRYVLPTRVDEQEPFILSLRPLAPVEDIFLYVRADDTVLFREHFQKIMPSSMIRIARSAFTVDPRKANVESVEVFFSKERL